MTGKRQGRVSVNKLHFYELEKLVYELQDRLNKLEKQLKAKPKTVAKTKPKAETKQVAEPKIENSNNKEEIECQKEIQ